MKTSVVIRNGVTSQVIELIGRLIDMIPWPNRRSAMGDVIISLQPFPLSRKPWRQRTGLPEVDHVLYFNTAFLHSVFLLHGLCRTRLLADDHDNSIFRPFRDVSSEIIQPQLMIS